MTRDPNKTLRLRQSVFTTGLQNTIKKISANLSGTPHYCSETTPSHLVLYLFPMLAGNQDGTYMYYPIRGIDIWPHRAPNAYTYVQNYLDCRIHRGRRTHQRSLHLIQPEGPLICDHEHSGPFTISVARQRFRCRHKHTLL